MPVLYCRKTVVDAGPGLLGIRTHGNTDFTFAKRARPLAPTFFHVGPHLQYGLLRILKAGLAQPKRRFRRVHRLLYDIDERCVAQRLDFVIWPSERSNS